MIVYQAPRLYPFSYVAYVDDVWCVWPAEKHGWSRRRAVEKPPPRDLIMLAPALARLAVTLSGVTE